MLRSGFLEELDGEIFGSLSKQQSLTGKLQNGRSFLTGTLSSQSSPSIPDYEGAYEVTPRKSSNVILQTRDKRMNDDVTVLKIPYWVTSNESGKTLYIGVD